MHIAAHISDKNHDKSLLLAILKILVAKYPNVKFTFFSEKPISELSKNCNQVIIAPKITNNILLYFWYSFRLPKLLKGKAKVAFISDAGMLCHAKGTTSQYLFYTNDYFWQDGNTYFKKAFELTLAKMQKVFTTEKFFEDELLLQEPSTQNKIETIYYGLSNTKKLLAPVTLELTKNKFTDGCDYFLYPVNVQSKVHLVVLLKAFSQLKKLQKTSMKLLLLLHNEPAENLIENFKNYKYKDEVVLVEETIENRKHLISSANGLFYFAEYEANGYAMMALQNEVPLILENNKKNIAIYEETAIFCEINDKQVAEKMQLLYKDESIKNALVIASTKWLEKYNIEKAAEQLFQSIYIP
jgi:glycosyltransferase involved in cell wall biosynthesis